MSKYLVQRALVSPYTDDVRDLFANTTVSERDLIRGEMRELQAKYHKSYPDFFKFALDDPDFDTLFKHDVRKITAGHWCGTDHGEDHVPEYYLARAKRAAQKVIECLPSTFSENQLVSRQIHIDAINDLFPSNANAKPKRDTVDDFDLGSYLVRRALKTQDPRDAKLVFENTTEGERELLKNDLRALHEVYRRMNPELFNFAIDDPCFDDLFESSLDDFSERVSSLSTPAEHDPEFYLAVAKQKAQARMSDFCSFPDIQRQKYQSHVDAIDNLFPNGKRQKQAS